MQVKNTAAQSAVVNNPLHKKSSSFEWSKSLPMQATGIKYAPVSSIKNENISNQDLAEELHKPIIKKRKVYSTFIDNNWGTDLSDMPLISKFNKEFVFIVRC